MSRIRIEPIVFLAGLAAVCWIAFGYAGTNLLAAAVTLLIGVCYLTGALELRRYQQATATLSRAVAGLSETPATLGAWLDALQPGLRNAVRARVEGERVALPAPALTPYLVGLLVLLGMLGTLLGMVVTLKGTGAALESAKDLDAIRASLAAPVKGLGFAFGTSIAGVATSAMLGLLSALCRRERTQAVQQLDGKIATTLRGFSHAHQREESFRLMQRQAEAMPTLVDRLQAMMATIEQQSVALHERQMASQQAFLGNAEAAYLQLASSVGQSLKESAADSARSAGIVLQPIMEAAMAGLARETAALHDAVTHAVQRQLDGLSAGFNTTTTNVTDIWKQALAGQQQSSDALVEHMRAALEQFTGSFEQRTHHLFEGVSVRLEAAERHVSEAWRDALSRQEQAGEKLAGRNEHALAAAAATFEQHAASLLRTVGQAHADLQAELASRDQQRLSAWTDSLASMAANLSDAWQQTSAHVASRQQAICDTLAQAARDITAQAATVEQRSASLLQTMEQSHTNLQTVLEARDQQRLSAWTDSLAAMAANLSDTWQQTSAHTASRQQAICDTLARTASDMTAQAQAHASETIGEIARLVQAASEAPKAAAEVVAELRQRLSDSMVRDTAMLEERNRMLETLETLLDAVNHASTEQRGAVDALVATSAGLLDRIGSRFNDTVDAETRKLDAVAAQVTASAVEVASLGDAFGMAAQSFGESNDKLMTHLQQIEAALEKSLARSDEQLAYYVAQAREVIDLSMMSQKQIVEELQQLAGQRAPVGA